MEPFDLAVTRTLDSGVTPIALKFQPVYDTENSRPVGYRGRAYINSILYGVLTPEDYLAEADGEEIGAEFALRNIRYTLSCLDSCGTDSTSLRFVSLQCPTSLLQKDSLRGRLAHLAELAGAGTAGKICLEFGETALFAEDEAVKKALADIRVAGYQTLFRNYGGPRFPMASLVDLRPDWVLLQKETIALLEDREKASSVSAFVRFARSLGIEVVADGARDDGAIRELHSLECNAYLPAPDYHGRQTVTCTEQELTTLLKERGGQALGGTD